MGTNLRPLYVCNQGVYTDNGMDVVDQLLINDANRPRKGNFGAPQNLKWAQTVPNPDWKFDNFLHPSLPPPPTPQNYKIVKGAYRENV